jgi:uncharacterized SAM-binding protein YcdF (DUF218 family)
MFLFKKIVSPFLFPASLCLEILLCGLFLLWFTKRQKRGKVAVTIGTALLLLLSYNFLPAGLLRGLEREYPPLQGAAGEGAAAANSTEPVQWIVILGGGHTCDPKIPVISRLSEASLVRLAEGIRLYRENTGSKLLVSGGGIFQSCTDARSMAEAAVLLGVPVGDVVLENKSRDTEEEALLIKEMLDGERFLLVTSAAHMPRSMALFRKQGMEPIPAPVGQMVADDGGLSPGEFFPGPDGLKRSTVLFYEWLGIAWAKMRARI